MRRYGATSVASMAAVAACATTTRYRGGGGFVEDSSDVFKYRNAEASDVRRTNPGVPLGSSQVERENLRAEQQKLVDEDKMTDWGLFYKTATVMVCLYTALQWAVDAGPPFEPTPYIPYEKPNAVVPPLGAPATQQQCAR